MTKISSQSARHRYTVIFEPAEEGGFVVRIPYLGISTQGETLEEGRAMAADAVTGYLACLEEEGLPLPEEPKDMEKNFFVEHLDITL